MLKQKFKFLEHTADVKFQAFGKNLEEAFKNSALALKEAIYEKKVQEKEERKIKVKGKDLESLLYNFLEELLYLLEAENFLVSKIENLKISKDIPDKRNLINKKIKTEAKKGASKDNEQFKLKAIIIGDKTSSYSFTNPVKAITYNDMFVKQEKGKNGKWICQVVLDV